MTEYKQDATEVLKALKEIYTYEEIAVMVGKSFACVYDWTRGKRKVCKGDYALLKSIYDKLEVK